MSEFKEPFEKVVSYLLRMRMISYEASPIRMQFVDPFICGRLRMNIDMRFPTSPNVPTAFSMTPGRKNSKKKLNSSLGGKLMVVWLPPALPNSSWKSNVSFGTCVPLSIRPFIGTLGSILNVGPLVERIRVCVSEWVVPKSQD